MKRDILFQYLADCGVVVPVAADKRELMQSILSHWGAPVADLSEVCKYEQHHEKAFLCIYEKTKAQISCSVTLLIS